MDIPADALLDEKALLRRARWGNHAAFAELYRLHASAIPTLACCPTGNRVTKVGGASTPLYAVNGCLVGAGRQGLVLAEAIPPTRFSSIQLIRRQCMLRRFDARAYKVLILDVEPDVKYYVGAQLLPDKMDRRSIMENQYWQPVVWKEAPERCP